MSAPESDERLVALARLGERSACEALVRRYLRPAYAVALSVVLVPADAEDVAQESLVHALGTLHHCRQPDHFAGWLLQGVRNRARNVLAWRRVREGPAEAADAEAIGLSGQPLGLRTSLLGALRALSPVQREVVLLHDLEGWTHAEIARSLATSETNSRQLLFQARRQLRELLQEEAPEKARHAT
jgi:RNA polymerase sigma-70 factor, ECF subfamily